MPVIYLDVLIVLNWFIDYLLLSLTARLLHLPTRRFRVVLGAALGGIAACQILLTVPTALSLLLHLLGAVLMIRIAFVWHGLKRYIRQVVTLFCVSALLSGLVTALWYLTGSETVLTRNGVIYCDISPLTLTVLALVSYAVIRLYERLTRKRAPAALDYTVTVSDGCGFCECRALYDTGLHLREPFSGIPVILVHREALMPYLPLPLGEALRSAEGGGAVCITPRLRMIPYRTVSGNGLLPAFVPAAVTVKRNGEPPRDITGVYVALSDEPGCGEYTALIGGDVLDL